MKPLPHSLSVRAVGLAAITSTKDQPCFFIVATFFLASANTSRKSIRSAFPPTAPCPGMTIVLSVTLAMFSSAARICPSMLPPGRVIHEGVVAIPESVSRVEDVSFHEMYGDVGVGMGGQIVFQNQRSVVRV